jgi:hypothetical protein
MEIVEMNSYTNMDQLKLTIITIAIAFTLITIEVTSSSILYAENSSKLGNLGDLIKRNDSLSAYIQGNLKFTDCDIAYDSNKGSMNFTNCTFKN